MRNLLYHVAPFNKNDMWRRNVRQLLGRIDLFNGRRVVAVVTGRGLADWRCVEEEFAGKVDEVIHRPNNPKLREVVTLAPLLEKVETLDPYQVTFYAHTKGVTRPVNGGVTCHPWADIMYETCLDYWPLVSDLLKTHAMAGSFKKVGRGFGGSKSTWHYSGTFFWFRNRDVFSRNWRRIDQKWWGSESWPGLLFKPEEVACIFHEGVVPTLDMYSMPYLKNVCEPELAAWRQQYKHKRLVNDAVHRT